MREVEDKLLFWLCLVDTIGPNKCMTEYRDICSIDRVKQILSQMKIEIDYYCRKFGIVCTEQAYERYSDKVLGNGWM